MQKFKPPILNHFLTPFLSQQCRQNRQRLKLLGGVTGAFGVAMAVTSGLHLAPNFDLTSLFSQSSQAALIKLPFTPQPIFATRTTLSASGSHVNNANIMTLGVELSPAMCHLYPNLSKLRQCADGNQVTVNYFDTGLRGRCSNQANSSLSPLQEKIVAKAIPDSYVRQQIWQTYGQCSGMSPSNYFRSITNLFGGLKLPSEVMGSQDTATTYRQFVQQMTAANAGLTSQGVRLYCQTNRRHKEILTHINVCYSGSGHFGQCGAIKPSNCPNEFVIDVK